MNLAKRIQRRSRFPRLFWALGPEPWALALLTPQPSALSPPFPSVHATRVTQNE